MAVDFHKLKNVQKNDICLVHGYIRNIEKTSLFSTNIPDLVYQTCLLFYWINERWDPKHKHDGYKIINNVITKTVSPDRYESAYLSQIVSNGSHHWKFFIVHKKKGTHNIDIGITNQIENPPTDSYFTKTTSDGYGYIITSAKLTGLCGLGRYGTKCYTGDIIDMFVNFRNLTLSYNVNGVSYGVAAKLNKTRYRGAISLYYVCDSLKLLSYKHTYANDNLLSDN